MPSYQQQHHRHHHQYQHQRHYNMSNPIELQFEARSLVVKTSRLYRMSCFQWTLHQLHSHTALDSDTQLQLTAETMVMVSDWKQEAVLSDFDLGLGY
jgi:hypothetical protein